MSQLLETFYTLFEADASSLDQGLKDSDKGADDLIDKLKKTDKQASITGETFAQFATKALGFFTAALSVGTVVTETIAKAEQITAIANTADALGVAVEELDAFGRAAQAAGGDAQGARDSLTDMAESIGEALQDVESGRAKTFAALKVSLKDVNGQSINAVEGILRLSDAVQGMSRQEAVFRIKELGITDNRTVEMVLRGRKELERMLKVQKEQGVITKQNAEEARRFTESLNRLRGAVDSAGTGFMTAIIPTLTVVVEWLRKVVEWAGEHSDVIVGFFAAIAAVVTAIYLPAMISAAAATLAATWPILAIAAVVTAVAAAFALAYDDIMNFIEGNDSFIGQIFEKYPQVKAIVFAIIEAFKVMGVIISGVWDVIKTGFVQMLDFIIAGVKQIYSGIKGVASFFGIGSDGESDIENSPAAKQAEENRPAGMDPDVPMVPGMNQPQRPAGMDPDVPMVPSQQNAAMQGVQAGRAQLAQASASPLNSTTSNAITNSSVNTRKETNLSIGELTVNTQATDAQGVANGVGGELQSQLANMDSEFSSGVDR